MTSSGDNRGRGDYIKSIPKKETTTSKIVRNVNYKKELTRVRAFVNGKLVYDSNDNL